MKRLFFGSFIRLLGFVVLTGCAFVPELDTSTTGPKSTPTASSTPTPEASPSASTTPAATLTPSATPTPAPSQAPTPSRPTGGIARTQLAELRLVDRKPAGIPKYVRKEFGSGWSDIDGNGCNQRDDVLLRDVHPGTERVQQQGRCPHDVLAGTWTDPYTGKTLTFTDLKDRSQSQAIQIDHVVPLAEAWRSGAYAWSYDERRYFSNDLDNLLAVDGPTNAAKGDDDPAAWRPRKGYQCSYATRWIRVKHEWDLGADASEVRALGEMLDYCPN